MTVPRRIGWVLALAAVVVVGGWLVFRNVIGRQRVEDPETTRRVNGDVVILSYAVPFPEIDRVSRLAAQPRQVERVGVFAIYPVELQSPAARLPALLKLEKLDPPLARQLRLSDDQLPKPRSQGRPPGLVVGELVARQLQLDAGDSLLVHVKSGAGITGKATVRCLVASVVDWGLAFHNDKLVYADLSHLTDFAVQPTGIELLLKSAELRRTVAKSLQAQLDARYKVYTLDEIVDPAALRTTDDR